MARSAIASNTGWRSVGELAITRRMSLVAVLTIERLLRLGEQAHILDGDNGLVGEGLEQGNLPLSEEASLGAPENDRADRDTLSHQRNAQYRAEARAPCVLGALGKLVRRGLHVGDLDRPPLEYRSTSDRPADQRKTELGHGPNRDRSVMGNE